jgi:hypothetical protein
MRRTLLVTMMAASALLLGVTVPGNATASVPKTKVALRVAGCHTCKVRLVQAVYHPGGVTYWHSRRKPVGADGAVAFTVPRQRTHGMSFELRAPWEGGTDSVPNVVTRNRGQDVGQRWTATRAKASKRAEGCWAGTSKAHVRLRFRVARVATKDYSGKSTHAAVAWSQRGLRSWKPMTPTWHGRIGNQDAFYCQQP